MDPRLSHPYLPISTGPGATGSLGHPQTPSWPRSGPTVSHSELVSAQILPMEVCACACACARFYGIVMVTALPDTSLN